MDLPARFEGMLILKLKSLLNPGKTLRNLLIVFLTLLHEELVDLINESSDDPEEDDSPLDQEWATIKCFFKSEMQTIALIRSLPEIIGGSRISPDFYRKGAAIFEVEN